MKLWSRDDFAAVLFAAVFALLAFVLFGRGFQGLERYAYDAGVRLRDEAPSDRIAVIAIDDDSIRNLGRWPWPRNLHAAMMDLLQQGGAKVIGSPILYFEEQTDPGLQYINEVADLLEKSSLTAEVPGEIEKFGASLDQLAQRNALATDLAGAYRESALVTRYRQDLDALAGKLTEAKTTLAADRTLADAIVKAHVDLAMTFTLGPPQGRPDRPLPDYVHRWALTNVVDRAGAAAAGWLPIPTRAAQFPIPILGAVASGVGHLNTTLDVDGADRFEPLVLQHYDEYYPSLALVIAAEALNLGPRDIEVRLGEGVRLGGPNNSLFISTTRDLRMYTHFYSARNGTPPFPVDSFFDVFTGKIPASKYKDKVVLIGASAAGVGDTFPTPVDAAMPPVLTLAHTVSSILKEDFYVRPDWAGWAELALFLLVTAYLALLLPRLTPAIAAAVTALLATGLIVAQIALMAGDGLWFKLVIPALLLVGGHLFMTVKRLRITERMKVSSEAEGAESNKMLGLAFQGQGQLDMAFEKFRRVQPADDRLLDLMYNLALDFERKRQFNKAENVYRTIATHNPKFRDAAQKMSRAKQLSETVILGTGGSKTTAGGTLVMDAGGGVEKPMLGRYQVEKELGKGAMGVVYLGKDPKIGRQVAIKTMALSEEFEPDELEDVKTRFFREAETAGRLSHPNIVSIFDAGEEHDLAYIAMEFIHGHDLTRHTKANNLLPPAEVLKIVSDAADALGYAHAQGIVHRDIKPANLMWLIDRHIVKVTDFGIARITDSSKTKTGMVLGTPSYMSPEQLAGKKVDGRSDLFSLGVTLYQMLTGALPFQADSMAALMFKIANEPHAPITTVRPDLPGTLDPIIDRALAKDANQRYQLGTEMARELRAVLDTL